MPFATQYRFLLQILCAAFLGVTFLQSGLDKVFDFKGNLSWLQGHFSKSIVKNQVRPMLQILTVVEIAAGTLCLLGIVSLIFTGSRTLGYMGVSLSGFSLVMLLTGQRLAKDYAGAAGLTGYFLIALLGISYWSA